MKKILSILLFLLYTTASFGLSVKQFYCCGQLSSVSFNLNQDINGESSKDGCCKNQFNNLKVKDTHILSAQSGSPAKYFTNLFLPNNLVIFYQDQVPAVSKRIVIANLTNVPPLHGGIPAYIFNCTYRI
jgi:hypothetical protein